MAAMISERWWKPRPTLRQRAAGASAGEVRGYDWVSEPDPVFGVSEPDPVFVTEYPTAFAWSSCAGLCGLRDDPLLAPHPVQRTLGADGYRALLAEALSEEDLAALRLYLQQQRAYGRDDFRAMVEAKTQRFAGVRPRIDRPRPNQSLKRDK